MVGRKLGIDLGRTKKIDGDFCLSEKAAPEKGRKLAITARQDRSEMVLEGANCTFGWILMVITSAG